MKTPSEETRTSWTILDLLKWTSDYFSRHTIDSPRATAEILLAHTLAVKRIDLYLRYDQPLNPAELQQFKASSKEGLRANRLRISSAPRSSGALILRWRPVP